MSKILDLALKGSKNPKKHTVISNEEAMELILAYAERRITCSGVKAALAAYGYKVSRGSASSVLGNRVLTLVRAGLLNISRPKK